LALGLKSREQREISESTGLEDGSKRKLHEEIHYMNSKFNNIMMSGKIRGR
jgi:hypothetical protein